MDTKNIYTVYCCFLESNDKLSKSIIKRLEGTDDPLNLKRYIQDCCMKCCKAVSAKKVTSKHMPLFANKIKLMCKTVRGGGIQTQEWFGQTDSTYSTNPNYTQDILKVDIDANIARPEISPIEASELNAGTWRQGGGGKRRYSKKQCLSMISREIAKCCKDMDRSMDKEVKDWLSGKVYANMECLCQESMMKDRLLKMPKA